jgi:hypothetical protein
VKKIASSNTSVDITKKATFIKLISPKMTRHNAMINAGDTNRGNRMNECLNS